MFDKIRKLKIKFINFNDEKSRKLKFNALKKDDSKSFNIPNLNNKDDSKSFNMPNLNNKNETVNVQKLKEVRSSCYCCSFNWNWLY